MIIVSQNRDEIVNFDKVDSIWICSDEEGRITIEATADTNATLGYYKTEERAKEVLQEIKEQYIDSQVAYMEATRMGRGIDVPDCFVYEMPEE